VKVGGGGATHLSLSGNADNCLLLVCLGTSQKGVEPGQLIDKKTANLIVGEKES